MKFETVNPKEMAVKSSVRITMWAAMACVALAAFSGPALAQDKPKTEAKPAAKPEAKAEAKAEAKQDGKPADKAAAGKVMCAVMDEPIDPKVFVRYKGKRVYMCCRECVGEFNKDPDKYAKNVARQWEAMPAHRAQVKCPVTGEAPNPEIFVEEAFYDLCFANADAKAKFAKDRAAYEGKLAECFTFQTKCPISNKNIVATAKKDIGGKTIYFCCNGCVGKATDETAKKVAEQAKANEAAYAKQREGAKKP